MSVREWFGVKKVIRAELNIDKALESLLCTYREALLLYFEIADAPNSDALLQQINSRDLSSSDKLFTGWLFQKGLPYLSELSGLALPDDDSLTAQLDYEKYILELEIGCGVGADLRSNLIDIIEEMPNRISQTHQLQNKYKIEISYNNVKENRYSTPKIEGAPQMGSFTLYRR